MKFHPNDLALEEFYLSQSQEHQALLKHLAHCARCHKMLQRVVERPPGELSSLVYEEALQRVECTITAREGAIIKERADAPALLVEMMKLCLEQQRLLIRNSPRFRTWGLLELLLERAFETVVQNPSDAEDLSRLALDLSERLDPVYYGAGAVQDMQARAWAYLANARRLRSDLRGAADAFFKAELCLKRGSRDPLEYAQHLDLKASLLRAQRQFQEALQLLEQAVGIFQRHGQPHRAGRSLVNMSTVCHYMGDISAAIPLLFKALHLIDPEVEPRLLLCARHNLSDYLASNGRFLEARKVYRETLPLYRDFPDLGTQSRRKWVKGRIAFGLGQLAQAESLLLCAREGFAAGEAPYDTALVSLELALIYAREGRTIDLRRIAEEMLPIFSSLQIQREALAALAFLRQALDAEEASVEVVSWVAEFFRRAQYDPALRFEAPAVVATS